MLEESGAGNLFYPGNYEHEISLQAKKEGVLEHSIASYPGLIDFLLSEKEAQWEKEVQLTFDKTQ